MTQEIKDAMAALAAAEEAEQAMNRQAAEARDRVKAAKEHIVATFMDLYRGLSMDTRNKVRASINAHATDETRASSFTVS